MASVRGCVFFLALGLCSAIDSAKLAELQAELAAKIPTLNPTTSTIAEWQTRADIVGGFVRLPFHDAFGFGTKPDGCLDQSLADHNGLQSIRLIVDPVCTRYAAFISRADCWVIVGSVAIVAAGGTAIPFRYGRTDCTDETTISDAGLLPSANPSSLSPPVNNAWHHVRDVFGYRARLSVREIVALMGADSSAQPRPCPRPRPRPRSRPRSRPPFALGLALGLGLALALALISRADGAPGCVLASLSDSHACLLPRGLFRSLAHRRALARAAQLRCHSELWLFSSALGGRWPQHQRSRRQLPD
jgi:hypothetical protein